MTRWFRDQPGGQGILVPNKEKLDVALRKFTKKWGTIVSNLMAAIPGAAGMGRYRRLRVCERPTTSEQIAHS